MTSIRKRRLLNNDEFTMGIISTKMLDSNYSKWSVYESIFAVLVRPNAEGNIPTSLSVFFIRHLGRLITTRKLYNSVHQCNKYLHYHMTSLSRNVYGTDIATSKLWLATFLLQQGDNSKTLQNVNDVLFSIPPYALYCSCGIMLEEDSKQLYIDRYCGQNTDILCRAKEAWFFDMNITHSEYSCVPRAIQIEVDYCDPTFGVVLISPFTYAYYLMFLCFLGLGQYDDRDRA